MASWQVRPIDFLGTRCIHSNDSEKIIPRRLKPRPLWTSCGTAEQLAEKWRSGSEFPENLPAGAKQAAEKLFA
jgi:hypothetical protein